MCGVLFKERLFFLFFSSFLLLTALFSELPSEVPVAARNYDIITILSTSTGFFFYDTFKMTPADRPVPLVAVDLIKKKI